MLVGKRLARKKRDEPDCRNYPLHALLRLPPALKVRKQVDQEKWVQSPLYKFRNCVAIWSRVCFAVATLLLLFGSSPSRIGKYCPVFAHKGRPPVNL